MSQLTHANRMHYIIYTLVVNKYATYKELRDDYNIDEVLDLYESCMVNMHNRNVLLEERRHK